MAVQRHACRRCGIPGHNARSCEGIPLTPEQVADQVRAKRQEEYLRNKTKIAARNRKYYLANKTSVLARTSAYQKQTRASANTKAREKWRDDPQLRARKKAWREVNRERSAAYCAKWRESNIEAARENHRRWRAANPDKSAAADRRWREENPDKVRAKNLLRDYRSATAGGRATAAQIRARVEVFGGVCSYCGGHFEHMDHAISLARGGTNWPANLRPACEACNLGKAAKPLRQFLAERGCRARVMPLP